MKRLGKQTPATEKSVASGKALRGRRPDRATPMVSAGRSARSGRDHHRVERRPGAATAADPLWSNASIPLFVLSRCGGDHGRRPGRQSDDRLASATCGDCHLLNFGVYATPERNLIFDINDFDETLPGPWEWDVKRLATSFVIASRHNGFAAGESPGGGAGDGAQLPSADDSIRRDAALDVWYDWLNVEDLLDGFRAARFASRRESRSQGVARACRSRSSRAGRPGERQAADPR